MVHVRLTFPRRRPSEVYHCLKSMNILCHPGEVIFQISLPEVSQHILVAIYHLNIDFLHLLFLPRAKKSDAVLRDH